MTLKQLPSSPVKLLDGGILYYPTIEFKDETWLKSALCVWDRVYRIVPTGYRPRDTDTVRKAVDLGLVESISLSEADLKRSATNFKKFWDKVPVIPDGLHGEQNARLHVEKVNSRVLPLLRKLRRKTAIGGFLTVPKSVADTYMLFLSDVVARRRSVAKLTDDSDMFALMHYFANDGNMDEFLSANDLPEMSVSLTLATVLPTGVDHASIEKIVEFRKESLEPRQAFRDAVTSFGQDLSKVEDERHAQKLAADFAEKLKRNAKQQGSIITQLGFDDGAALISVGLPTTLTAWSTAIAAGKGFDPFFIGGSVLTGLVAGLADAAKTRRKNWKKTDLFYYLSLKHAFKEKNSIRLSVPKYDRILEEFMND
jgi:hypothetical protein